MEIPGTPLPLFAYAVLIFLVWFLVARPGATSSIQPSSEINGRHTYQAQTLEAHTHTHTLSCLPNSRLAAQNAVWKLKSQLNEHAFGYNVLRLIDSTVQTIPSAINPVSRFVSLRKTASGL